MMYQASLFESMATKHGTYLGAGLFSTVHLMTDGTVCKIGNNDGTRNWLELCAMHTAAGTLLPMMPEVFRVIELEGDKYMAFMPCYESMEGCNLYRAVHENIHYSGAELLFKEYLEMRRGHPMLDWEVFNDIHRGNVMRCAKRGVVITDPNASDYMLQTAAVPFTLN
jgi:hypothetical protein